MREKMKYMGQAKRIWKDKGKIMVKDMKAKGKVMDKINIRMRAKGMQFKNSQKVQWCRYK